MLYTLTTTKNASILAFTEDKELMNKYIDLFMTHPDHQYNIKLNEIESGKMLFRLKRTIPQAELLYLRDIIPCTTYDICTINDYLYHEYSTLFEFMIDQLCDIDYLMNYDMDINQFDDEADIREQEFLSSIPELNFLKTYDSWLEVQGIECIKRLLSDPYTSAFIYSLRCLKIDVMEDVIPLKSISKHFYTIQSDASYEKQD